MKTMPTMIEVMTPFPHTVQANESLKTAIAIMAAENIRHLPVLQNSQLVGLITDRDIKLAVAVGKGLPESHRLKVEDVCIAEPYTTEHSTRLDVVLDEMLSQHIGSALVTRGGKVVGIFTLVDACKQLRQILGTQYPDA